VVLKLGSTKYNKKVITFPTKQKRGNTATKITTIITTDIALINNSKMHNRQTASWSNRNPMQYPGIKKSIIKIRNTKEWLTKE